MKPTSIILLALVLGGGLPAYVAAQTGYIAIAPLDSGSGRVVLDGKFVGRVRDSLFTVQARSGMHDLRVKVKGFKEFRSEVRVTEGEVTSVKPLLELLTGATLLDVEPAVITPAGPASTPWKETGKTARARQAGAYLKSELHSQPHIKGCPRLRYPRKLREAGVSGEVLLEGVIDVKGRIESWSIKVISTTHQAFAKAAVDMFQGCRYTPGTIDEKAVRVFIEQPVSFKIGR